MIKAAVIGHPISQSKSPAIHNYWIAHHGFDGSYEAIDIAPADLSARVAQMVQHGYAGFNVTIPHKQAIIPLCTTLSAQARAIGAVNTVVIDHAGHLHGDNTDGYGFAQNLMEQIPDFDWAHAPALVLGAGGAARAIIYTLTQLGAPAIHITNRTLESAQHLASEFGATAHPWEERSDLVARCGLIVNTTSLGMVGKEPLSINLSTATARTVVYDIVYNPLITNLLADAQAQSLRTVTGLGMLLHQARPAFEKWFGVLPDVSHDLRAQLNLG